MLEPITRRFGPPAHEELFLACYPRLLTWARQLTGQDTALAFALVHDAYIHFVLVRPPLDQIRNADAYLFTTLRNMHVSHRRRIARSPLGPDSVADYDTASLGMRAFDAHERIRTRVDLAATCQYACARRETSKAASALILRFFHGYYPAEIARLLASSTGAVAQFLRAARAEARQHLLAPVNSPLAAAGVDTGAAAGLGPVDSDRFVQWLQDRVFDARGGACLDRAGWRAIYRTWAGKSRGLSVATAAHLVSCRTCLDVACELLGLPPLAARHPVDSSGPDIPSAGGGPSGGSRPPRAAATSLERQQRLRGVVEHRPRELRLAINGAIVVTQPVTSARTEHTVSLDVTREAEFVEVLSEQDVRLLFVNVLSPPGGDFEQVSRITLSDARTLTLRIDFSGRWPHVHVIYRDDAAVDEQPAADANDLPATEPIDERQSSEHRSSGRPRWRALLFPVLQPRLVLALLVLAFLAGIATAPTTAAELAARVGRLLRTLVGVTSVEPARPSSRHGAESVAPAIERPTAASRVPAVRVPARRPPMPSARDLAEAEVGVLHALHNVGALLGEQVGVRRTSTHVRLEGVVDDGRRRQALIAAMAGVRHQNLIETDLRVAGKRRPRRREARVVAPAVANGEAPVAFTEGEPPAYDLVRRLLLAEGGRDVDGRGDGHAGVAEVRRVAGEILAAAERATLHAWALERLVTRVPAGTIATLDARASDQWHSVLHAQARDVHAALAAIAVITDRLPPGGGDGSAAAINRLSRAPVACGEIAASLAELSEVVAQVDRTVRANLSHTPDSAGAEGLDTSASQARVARGRTLAAQLTRSRCTAGPGPGHTLSPDEPHF